MKQNGKNNTKTMKMFIDDPIRVEKQEQRVINGTHYRLQELANNHKIKKNENKTVEKVKRLAIRPFFKKDVLHAILYQVKGGDRKN